MKGVFISMMVFLCWSCAKEGVYLRNNNLFVVSSKNILYEIDPTSFKIDSIILDLAPAQANHVSRSADGRYLAMALPETSIGAGGHSHGVEAGGQQGGVLIYDVQIKKIKKRIRLPQPNYNAVYTEEGLFTATYTTNGTIYGFDASTLKPKTEVLIGDEPTQLSDIKGTDFLTVALSHNTYIKLFSKSKNEEAKSIKVSNFPTNTWAGKRYIYVQNSSNIIDIVDSQTQKGVWSGSVSSVPGRIVELNSGIVAVAMPTESKINFYTFQNEKLSLIASSESIADPHSMIEKDNRLWVVGKKSGKLTLINLETYLTTKTVYLGRQINDLTF